MPHYLVTGFLPDDFDPSKVTETMIRDIDVLNDEMEAAGVRVLGLASPRPAARSRCGRSPMERCASPTGRTWRPRSTSAVSWF